MGWGPGRHTPPPGGLCCYGELRHEHASPHVTAVPHASSVASITSRNAVVPVMQQALQSPPGCACCASHHDSSVEERVCVSRNSGDAGRRCWRCMAAWRGCSCPAAPTTSWSLTAAAPAPACETLQHGAWNGPCCTGTPGHQVLTVPATDPADMHTSGSGGRGRCPSCTLCRQKPHATNVRVCHSDGHR